MKLHACVWPSSLFVLVPCRTLREVLAPWSGGTAWLPLPAQSPTLRNLASTTWTRPQSRSCPPLFLRWPSAAHHTYPSLSLDRWDYQNLYNYTGYPAEQYSGSDESQMRFLPDSFLHAFTHTTSRPFFLFFPSALSSFSTPLSTGWAKFACKYSGYSVSLFYCVLCRIQWHFFFRTSTVLDCFTGKTMY